MNDVVISAQNVSKAYRIWATPAARLTSPAWQLLANAAPAGTRAHRALSAKARAAYRDFYALRDVSLDVRKGECLGIVGRNGSGKSTLLQLLAGTLQPSGGELHVSGRVAALLELGSGFNPEFTGRENVFLNASILGLTRAQIEARYDDILRFAEIGDFINEPVKIYSSGMAVRLAFAVIAHVSADVMIIDEALAVGDARFQLKCARAIDRFLEQGVTMLFVSHSMSMVKRLCSRAILLEQGSAIYSGKPNDVVNLYSKLTADGGSVESLAPDLHKLRTTPEDSHGPGSPRTISRHSSRRPSAEMGPVLTEASKEAKLLEDERAHVQVSGSEYAYGGELGRIEDPVMQGFGGDYRDWFTTGEDVTLSFSAVAREVLSEPIYALTIKNQVGQEVYGTNTFYNHQTAPAIQVGERHRISFRFPMNLIAGTYFISLGWTHFVGESLVVVHRRYDVIKFDVHGVDQAFGIANLWAQISVDTDL